MHYDFIVQENAPYFGSIDVSGYISICMRQSSYKSFLPSTFWPLISTKSMETDFVFFLKKMNQIWAQQRLEGIFYLYALEFLKSTSQFFLFFAILLFFRPICSKKSMHSAQQRGEGIFLFVCAGFPKKYFYPRRKDCFEAPKAILSKYFSTVQVLQYCTST